MKVSIDQGKRKTNIVFDGDYDDYIELLDRIVSVLKSDGKQNRHTAFGDEENFEDNTRTGRTVHLYLHFNP